MAKRKRLIARREPEHFRDDRRFVIASEDTYAAQQYFEALRMKRVLFRVIPASDTVSCPAHILDNLRSYKSDPDFLEDDELWLVLDTDHWTTPSHIKNLARVCKEAKELGAKIAITNPCFEYWLLLHLVDPPLNTTKCKQAEEMLRGHLGAYNKTNVQMDDFRPFIHDAVERAKQHDPSPGKDWPESEGSHIYRIFDEIGLDNLR